MMGIWGKRRGTISCAPLYYYRLLNFQKKEQILFLIIFLPCLHYLLYTLLKEVKNFVIDLTKKPHIFIIKVNLAILII